MNIWIVMSGEPLEIRGERPHRVGMLTNLLSKRGHKVTWWSTTFDHQEKEYIYNEDSTIEINKNLQLKLLHSSIPYSRNISINRILNHFYVGKKLRRESNDLPLPDLIFCAFPTIDLAYSSVKLGNAMGIPVVIDIRDLWPDIFVDPFPKSLRGLVRVALSPYFNKTKYIFNNCDAITAVSEKYLQWGLKYGKRNKGSFDKVFPLAYDISQLSFNKDKEDIAKEDVVVWFIGTFGTTYDLDTVIESARLFASESNLIKNVKFILTGDGENMSKWKKAASGLNNVTFTGWVNKDQVKDLSLQANIGLMAYRKGAPQGLPNKIFEYMAAGLPILSSLQTETKDVLEDNNIGITYEAGNALDLANKIQAMIINDNYIEMGKKAKQVLLDNYSADKVYNDLIDYLEEIKN